MVEIRKIVETCVSILSFFHPFGLRTKELKKKLLTKIIGNLSVCHITLKLDGQNLHIVNI